MKVGTKSLLFGYHQFLIHPFLVWAGWVRLYGWTWDLRVILAFFLHDVGYWGKPNMDGVEGEQHPFFGAKVLHFLFDGPGSARWYHFSLYHSRYLARTYFAEPSDLCWADKQAFIMYPLWLLKGLYWLSGEDKEYRMNKYADDQRIPQDRLVPFDEWYKSAVEGNRHSLSKRRSQ